MRAVRVTEYGGPEVLEVVDMVDEPILGPDSVIVSTRAASINPVDYKVVAGALQGAFRSYLPMTPGWDVAGVVETAGPAVTTVAEGQRVIGYARKDYLQDGTWAQRTAVPQRCLVAVPDELDMITGACLPLAGLTAWQCLDAVGVADGDTVLIHSASGGVGHLAVQLARARGATVIGSASAANADFVRALGATPVDYRADVSEQVRGTAPGGVDAIVDLHSAESLVPSLGLLHDATRFVTVAAADVAHERGGRYVFVHTDTAQLSSLVDMAVAGTLRVTVSGRHPLSGVRDAVSQAMAGVRGKVVLDLSE